MKTSSVKKLQNEVTCIDEMDALLDKIDEFKQLLHSQGQKPNPSFKQEYRLFKQHIEWVTEDLIHKR